MNANNNGSLAKNVFSSMLRWQVSATVVVAVIALAIFGMHAGLSALLGGLSVALSAMVASKVAQRSNNEASAILVNMLKAEGIKILLIVILLLITFKVYKQLVPFALIAGLAASALFSGAAMTKFSD